MKPTVSIAACTEYDFKKVKRAIVRCLKPLGGIKAFVKPRQKVLLKPNALGAFPPEAAVTTHPAIVRAVVQLVKEAKAKPIIAESCGIGINAITSRALLESGMKAVADSEGIGCSPLETMGFRKLKEGASEYFVSKAFLDADVVISLPKLKTHALTTYTGAIKNSFAVVPTRDRRSAHNRHSEAEFCSELVAIFSARKPELVIIDAIVGMEGMGPAAGTKKKLGVVIASNDAVALDAVVCDALGFGKINTLVKAREMKAGETDLKKIRVVGTIPRIAFKKPFTAGMKNLGFFAALLQNFTKVQPFVEKGECKKCGICARHCPAGAIEIAGFPKINRKKCVCCFCCAELCPEQAIKVRMGAMGSALVFFKSKTQRILGFFFKK